MISDSRLPSNPALQRTALARPPLNGSIVIPMADSTKTQKANRRCSGHWRWLGNCERTGSPPLGTQRDHRSSGNNRRPPIHGCAICSRALPGLSVTAPMIASPGSWLGWDAARPGDDAAPICTRSGGALPARNEVPSGLRGPGLGRTREASAACVRTRPHPVIRVRHSNVDSAES
jgi:hypothetical protein